MVIAVKTREFKRDLDYDWEDYFPSDKSLSVEAGKILRALEGVYVDSRFAVLLRSATGVDVMLGVSVSTSRRDAVGGVGNGRPIRTMAFLRAETSEETELLAAFFAECLRKSDTETLYDATSGVAKAVESLYQTKKLDDFLRFCRSLPAANGSGAKPTGRRAIPRGDTASRQEMVESLPALIRGRGPFLITLTDRLPAVVLSSLGSMVDRGVVRIFSNATSTVEKLPEPAPQKFVRAAAIGGAVLLAILVAAIRSCSNPGREGPAPRDTNIVSRAIDGGEASTNSSPPSERGGEPTGETRQGVVFTNAVPTSEEGAAPVTSGIPNHMQ